MARMKPGSFSGIFTEHRIFVGNIGKAGTLDKNFILVTQADIAVFQLNDVHTHACSSFAGT
jgi:hypothetical protein